MKDTRNVLMLLLSIGLVGTWVFHLYDKSLYSKQSEKIFIKDSAAVAEGVRDSLQKIYSSTISTLDTRLDSTKGNADSLQGQLNVKLLEINKLRKDIGDILKNRGATKADMDLARTKIDELKEKVDELRGENSDMEEEKKRLNGILEQLTGEMQGLQQNVKKLGDENKNLTEKINLASIFVASEIQLHAVGVKNSKELETTVAKKTSKFVLSFTVQNNINEYPSADVYVVIVKPDGEVMQNSVWDAGEFDTRNEGKKKYTVKMHFVYSKGDAKHLVFTLTPDEFESGNYTMQLYHNGAMIGQTVKTLS